MTISLPFRPLVLAVLVVVVIPLLPTCNEPVARNADLDVELVRSARCEYRGITGNFEELSRAYAIRVYQGAEFAGWQARPNPRHPEAEALVTATFAVAGLQESPPASWGRGPEVRERVGDRLALTWCLNTVAGVCVTPHDDYARDAVEVFRETVDDHVDRMVYLIEPAILRSAPSPAADTVAQLDIGQILLRERREGSWIYARLPSTRTQGWVDGDLAQSVND